MSDRIIICRTVFGSRLYGTDTPESDTDYKSVFLPTVDEILTGRIPKSITMSTGKHNDKNTKDDVDHESFSLHYFMQLLYQGQTVALDMLHGNVEEVTTPMWRELKEHKHEFYTKKHEGFRGLCPEAGGEVRSEGQQARCSKRGPSLSLNSRRQNHWPSIPWRLVGNE